MKVYKAMERRWAAHLIRSGELLIGTLHGFRSEEMHGLNNSTVDPTEGKIKWQQSIEDETLFENIALNSPAHRIMSGSHKTSSFQNCSFTINTQIPNCYIYSMSEEADPDMGRELNQQYNCFIEISDEFEFFRLLSAQLLKKNIARPFGLNKCEYTDKTIKFPEIPTQKIAFTKEEHFAHQKEIRAIWAPLTAEPIEPIKLKYNSIKHLVRLHSTF